MPIFLSKTKNENEQKRLYMIHEQKLQVRMALLRYVSTYPTQKMAAKSLQGIDENTISKIKNNQLILINDDTWLQLARQVGFYCGDWHPADTRAYMLLRILFSDAQHYTMAYGITIAKGLGKTFAAIHYARQNPGTFYLPCTETLNRNTFIQTLLTSAALEPKKSVPEMMQQFTDHIKKQSGSLLIFDDAHQLKDRAFHFLITLINTLFGSCGIIMMGDDQLRWRLIEAIRLGEDGFDKVYKSIGRRFITLTHLGPRDVELVCKANGLLNENEIQHVKELSKGDLHNMAELIQQHNYSIAA